MKRLLRVGLLNKITKHIYTLNDYQEVGGELEENPYEETL
ncbi:hypothetical protein CSC35_4822 [Enterobacter hormaechei]|nr:hypothetical protein CSC35_4822 [Enterobacter hormaechei]